MKINMDIKDITEEYINDPHWNSGFWQTTIEFGDGIKGNKYCRKDSLTTDDIIHIYVARKTDDYLENRYVMRAVEGLISRFVEQGLTVEDVIEKLNLS
jgi:hypothetical protein